MNQSFLSTYMGFEIIWHFPQHNVKPTVGTNSVHVNRYLMKNNPKKISHSKFYEKMAKSFVCLIYTEPFFSEIQQF